MRNISVVGGAMSADGNPRVSCDIQFNSFQEIVRNVVGKQLDRLRRVRFLLHGHNWLMVSCNLAHAG